MNAFIFQSMPDRFDLQSGIVPGANDTWYATRYRKDMRPGDIIFFWMGGSPDTRGIYGWGHISSQPYEQSNWDAYGVDVVYTAKFSAPLLARDLKQDSLLSSMLIFRAPQATNFLLSESETKRLTQLIRERGEEVPPLHEKRP